MVACCVVSLTELKSIYTLCPTEISAWNIQQHFRFNLSGILAYTVKRCHTFPVFFFLQKYRILQKHNICFFLVLQSFWVLFSSLYFESHSSLAGWHYCAIVLAAWVSFGWSMKCILHEIKHIWCAPLCVCKAHCVNSKEWTWCWDKPENDCKNL